MQKDEDLPNLLLVDDDELFCRVLSAALEKRGFSVQVSYNVADAIELIGDAAPEYAVVDLSMPGGSGLLLVEKLHQLDKHTRIVVLTGYASIATAVEAIKLGATHYLTKPADADEVVAALGREDGDSNTEIAGRAMSAKRVEWEHIQKMLMKCDGNISETARRLGMHRRTLQRKLNKRPSKI